LDSRLGACLPVGRVRRSRRPGRTVSPMSQYAPEDLECLPARVRGTGRCLRAARTHLLAMAWALTLAANPAPKPLSFTRTATPTLPAAAKGPVRGAPDIRDGPERPTVVMSANSADTQT
jgi:hypothetical protein